MKIDDVRRIIKKYNRIVKFFLEYEIFYYFVWKDFVDVVIRCKLNYIVYIYRNFVGDYINYIF